jgi:hypothetical protein
VGTIVELIEKMRESAYIKDVVDIREAAGLVSAGE